MIIVVIAKKIWGKELFYPVSDDAQFVCELTGRPTILKKQLRILMDKGWDVVIKPEITLFEKLMLKKGEDSLLAEAESFSRLGDFRSSLLRDEEPLE